MTNKFLCIDTTSEYCSVSLFEDNNLIEFQNSIIERSHSKLLILIIDEILKKSKTKISEIDAFSISKGPGSYTGLRIGLSSVKGFCFGLNKPLISINTLKVLSKSALSLINNKNSILCPMVDARRMEVFTKLYDCQLNSLSDDKSLVLDENSFDLYNDKEIYFFGNGSDKFEKIVKRKNFTFIKDIMPDSRFMGDITFEKYNLNEFEDISTFEPNYIKDFYLIKKKGKWMRS
tara:strand:+ start:331 stop:1026 length:696 start_codon:yes stop_codon:yes gene_type:complete